MKKGIVFDIQRFSLHDGPGIRTTVFLKGCPLKCKWCHNPESWSIQPQLMFYNEKCVNCLRCVESCKYGAHKIENGVHVIDFDLCNTCGNCVSNCVYSGLKMSGKEMCADEVLKEVFADISYYKNSGGGMTISGGEPTLQFDFLMELLTKAKEKGVHTCLETCGFAPTEKYEKLLPYVDIFLYDIKHINDKKHKDYTGVSNRLILDNLDFIYNNGGKVILRCPIIPGVNDTDEHIMGVSSLQKKYPEILKVDILPYHDMGKSKWSQIGNEYSLNELKNMEEQAKQELHQRFLDAGCSKATI